MFEEMFSMEKEKVTGRKKKRASVRRVIPFTQLIIEKKNLKLRDNSRKSRTKTKIKGVR
jgi:hypothetical protein